MVRQQGAAGAHVGDDEGVDPTAAASPRDQDRTSSAWSPRTTPTNPRDDPGTSGHAPEASSAAPATDAASLGRLLREHLDPGIC